MLLGEPGVDGELEVIPGALGSAARGFGDEVSADGAVLVWVEICDVCF